MMNRRFFLASSAVAVLPFAVPAAFAASSDTAVTAPVQALDSALIGIMKAGSQNQSFIQRYGMLKPVVENTFDLPEILQVSVGLLWSQIPAAQQAQLQNVFDQYTVAAYVHGFDSYDGQTFKLMPGVRQAGAQRVVTTELVPKSGDPTTLSYVMSNVGGQWKATDILFNGTISKVATQRSDFGNAVAPGNATKLITALQHKVAFLSNGTLKS